MPKLWVNELRKTLVCVDSYDKGVPSGRFYKSLRSPESFSSLSAFLLKMEEFMDEVQEPQSYNAMRSFSSMLMPDTDVPEPASPARGALASFEIQVLFRKNSSWQGIIIWREKKIEQSFRSVLELIMLMDSALRSSELSA